MGQTTSQVQPTALHSVSLICTTVHWYWAWIPIPVLLAYPLPSLYYINPCAVPPTQLPELVLLQSGHLCLVRVSHRQCVALTCFFPTLCSILNSHSANFKTHLANRAYLWFFTVISHLSTAWSLTILNFCPLWQQTKYNCQKFLVSCAVIFLSLV